MMNNELFYNTSKQNGSLAYKQTDFTRRCIDGSVVGCSKCVGYCAFCEHPGFLTEKLRKKHDCLGKECFHYIAKPAKEKHYTKTLNLSNELLSYVQKEIDLNEGLKVIRVELDQSNSYKAYFVAITNHFCLDRYVSSAKERFGANLVFERLNYDFEVCASLICAY